jgi:uncharacterized repeat protein (TIGR01451 family)
LPGLSGRKAVTVTATKLPVGTLSYDTLYCSVVTLAQYPTLNVLPLGLPAGKYSKPVGLHIDTLTGAIIPESSETGHYTVTYTVPAGSGCPAVPIVSNSFEIAHCHDLTLTKTASASTVCPGSELTYTVALKNNAKSTANNITLIDLWPSANFDYVSHTVSRGSYNSGTRTWTISALEADSIATLTIRAMATAPGVDINNQIYVSAVNGLTFSDFMSSEITGEVSVTVNPLSTSGMITARDTTVCSGKSVMLAATASSVTEPVVFRWYASDTSTTPLYTGNPFATPATAVDTNYYVTVSGGNYCENPGDRKAVHVAINCITVRGTVFPFIHRGNSNDTLFKYTVSLYNIPSGSGYEQLEQIQSGAVLPVYDTTAVYYDGSIFIPGTPKNPGNLGSYNFAGVPISWNYMGKPTNLADTATLPNASDTTQYPLGMYTFADVEKGTYILRISRPGYMNRFAKVTLGEDGFLEHRALVPGDVDRNNFINVLDFTRLTANMSVYGEPRYDPRYDLDGNTVINVLDGTLLAAYLGFFLECYQDTMEWLTE